MCTETLERTVSTLSQIMVKKGNAKGKLITKEEIPRSFRKESAKECYCKVVYKLCVGFIF